MGINKVCLAFMTLMWQLLVPFAKNVSEKLYADVRLAGCTVTKIIFDAAILLVETTGAAALHGPPQKTQLRKNAVKALLVLMRRQVSYVDGIACGDMEIILASGFDATTSHSRTSDSSFKCKPGKLPGEVDASWGRIEGACSYEIQYALNEDGQREIYMDGGGQGNTGMTISGMESGRSYIFFLRVIYPTWRGGWSEPVTCKAA
jgi:hypothetical protein